jgi:hypothetical protein
MFRPRDLLNGEGKMGPIDVIFLTHSLEPSKHVCFENNAPTIDSSDWNINRLN